MALRDWNGNGKDDIFDRFMDYKIYELTFGKEDDKDTEAKSIKYEKPISAPSYLSQSYSSDRSRQKPEGQEEVYGRNEIARKNTEDILRSLVSRKMKMEFYFETCSVESGFREVMDNRQMGKDFWLSAFVEQLEFSLLQRPQKVQLLQLLLDTFSVENPMTAEEHYQNMEMNTAYYEYISHCFRMISRDGLLFWKVLGTMSGNNGERLDMTMGFTREYLKFMIQLEEYLKQMFPESGFGGQMQKYVVELTGYIKKVTESNTAPNKEYLVNPVFPCRLG